MGFFQQFDQFDPLTGVVPHHPFSSLPIIVRRARAILSGRTRDEIVSAAQSADWFIEEYFRGEKESVVQQINQHGGSVLGYLPEQERTEAGIRGLLDNWPPEATDPPPDFPNDENTFEIDALKNCISDYVLDDDSAFPNGHEFEYFAVLALWLAADALKWLEWTSDSRALVSKLDEILAPMPPGVFPDLTEAINSQSLEAKELIPALVTALQSAMQTSRPLGVTDTSIAFSLAGSCALCAMDSVCYAEHLKATEAQTAELARLRIKLVQQSQQSDALAEAKAKRRISVQASKAAIKKNTENRAMKADVIKWYAEHKNEYSSMDAAAAAIIAKKLVPLGFRTVRGHIGEYSRRVRSARTP